jgi:hypothetical protein
MQESLSIASKISGLESVLEEEIKTSRARYSSGSESRYAISRQRRGSISFRASKKRNSQESRTSAHQSNSNSSLQRGIVKERDMRKSYSPSLPVTHPSIDREAGKRDSVCRAMSNLHEETTYSSILVRKATVQSIQSSQPVIRSPFRTNALESDTPTRGISSTYTDYIECRLSLHC